MSLSIKKFALIAPLLFVSACTMTWPGQGRGTAENAHNESTDVGSLQGQYDTQKYFSDVKRRKEGRENAFGRDLDSITATVDRHFFNYSADDPYVNHPSTASAFNHLMRFTIDNSYPAVSFVETGAIVRR